MFPGNPASILLYPLYWNRLCLLQLLSPLYHVSVRNFPKQRSPSHCFLLLKPVPPLRPADHRIISPLPADPAPQPPVTQVLPFPQKSLRPHLPHHSDPVLLMIPRIPLSYLPVLPVPVLLHPALLLHPK